MSTKSRAARWTLLPLTLAVAAALIRSGAGSRADDPSAAARRDEAERLLREAERLEGQGKIDEALAAAEKALVLKTRPELDGAANDRTAEAFQTVAGLQERKEDFPAARKSREKVLEIVTGLHGEKDWRTTDARLAVADVARLAALEPARRRRLAEAREKNIKAVEQGSQGKYREALALAEEARDALKELLGGEHPDYAAALSNVAGLHRRLGEYDLAEPPAVEALNIFKNALGESHPRYGLALNGLGGLYNDIGFSARARPLFEQAREVYRAAYGGAGNPYFATTTNNLAVLAMNEGRYGDAETLYRQCLALLKTIGGEKDFDYLMGMNNLAVLYLKLGRYREAEDWLRKAMAGYEQAPGGKRHPDYAVCLHNLARLHFARKEYAAAEKPLLTALDVIEDRSGKECPAYADSISLLGLVRAARGDYDGAEAAVNAALKIRRRVFGEDRPPYAHSLANLAAVENLRGDYAAAERHLRDALKVTERALGERHPECSVHHWSLAAVLAAAKRPAEARDELDRALSLEQDQLMSAFSFSTEQAMYESLAAVGDSLDALLTLTPAGPDADAAGVGRAMTWTLRRKTAVLDALLRLHDAERDAAKDPAFAGRILRLRAARQQLVNLVYDPPTDLAPAEQNKRRADLRAECQRLEVDLNRDLAKGRSAVDDDPDAEAVRRRLPAGSALVEFVRTRPFDFAVLGKEGGRPPARYLAFVLPAAAHAPVRLIDLGLAADIDGLVKKAREKWELSPEDLKDPGEKGLEEKYRAEAKELYDAAFAPLNEALGKAYLVYLAPDGALDRVPFEALPDGPRSYLVESRRFVYLACGRDLLRPRDPPGRGALVIAGPDYDMKAAARLAKVKELLGKPPEPSGSLPAYGPSRQSGEVAWKALGKAADEAEAVRAAVDQGAYGPAKVYRGAEALEEVFKAKTRPAPRLLHVVTHGFFYPEPEPDAPIEAGAPALWAGVEKPAGRGRIKTMQYPLLRSGLVLAGANAVGEGAPEAALLDDGYLTAAEAALLDLRGTDLVVLSACETGLGDVRAGSGTYGLRAALSYAGARTVVTSLFHVPDEETAALMEAFYRNLKAGKGKSESLYAAERELLRKRRDRGGAAHPFFWGAFVLVGDP